jgi:hypothetical protein
MTADQLAEHEEGIRRAEATWRKVQDMMMDIPISVRQAVYNLCVLNEAIGPILLHDVRQVLDAMVPRLSGERGTIRPFAKLGPVMRGTEEDYVKQRAAPRPSDAHLSALEAVLDKAREEPRAEMSELWKLWLALVDRYRLRAIKG